MVERAEFDRSAEFPITLSVMNCYKAIVFLWEYRWRTESQVQRFYKEYPDMSEIIKPDDDPILLHARDLEKRFNDGLRKRRPDGTVEVVLSFDHIEAMSCFAYLRTAGEKFLPQSGTNYGSRLNNLMFDINRAFIDAGGVDTDVDSLFYTIDCADSLEEWLDLYKKGTGDE